MLDMLTVSSLLLSKPVSPMKIRTLFQCVQRYRFIMAAFEEFVKFVLTQREQDEDRNFKRRKNTAR